MAQFRFITERSHDTRSFAEMLQRSRGKRDYSASSIRPRMSPPDTMTNSILDESTTSAQAVSTPSAPSMSTRESSISEVEPSPAFKPQRHHHDRETGSPERHGTTSLQVQPAGRDARFPSSRSSKRYRTRLQPVSAETRAGWPTRGPRCCFCERIDKKALQCQSCSDPVVYLCSLCIINAPFVHPYPGHIFAAISQQPGPDAADQVMGIPQDEMSDAESNTTRGSHVVEVPRSSRGADHELPSTVPPSYCFFCSEALFRLWYECQSCPGMRLCSDCSDLHLRHPLTTVHQAQPERGESPRDKDNTEAVVDIGGVSSLDVVPTVDDLLGTDLWEDDSSQHDTVPRDTSTGPNDNGTDDDSFDEEEGHSGAEGDTSMRQVSTHNRAGLQDLGPISVEDFLTGCRTAMSQAMENAIDEFFREAGNCLRRASGNEARQFHTSASRTTPRRRGRSLRPWLPEHRRQLAKLKRKGWTNEQIGSKMKRTAGAVAQQWRKQQAT